MNKFKLIPLYFLFSFIAACSEDKPKEKETTLQATVEHHVTSYIKSFPQRYPDYKPGKFGFVNAGREGRYEIRHEFTIDSSGKPINKNIYFHLNTAYDIINVYDKSY